MPSPSDLSFHFNIRITLTLSFSIGTPLKIHSFLIESIRFLQTSRNIQNIELGNPDDVCKCLLIDFHDFSSIFIPINSFTCQYNCILVFECKQIKLYPIRGRAGEPYSSIRNMVMCYVFEYIINTVL